MNGRSPLHFQPFAIVDAKSNLKCSVLGEMEIVAHELAPKRWRVTYVDIGAYSPINKLVVDTSERMTSIRDEILSVVARGEELSGSEYVVQATIDRTEDGGAEWVNVHYCIDKLAGT
ncbi:hypothetical protein BBP00_00009630 [Phytophthora kernoviae]|uniref:Uncharacterized protein n=1 Tax=Phytophthora kernoviae TaxID=325452 RepID=A0A3F2RC53_9STRA|nr:hypothetical protein BBP00_00009630 [Phytophthora kernoviae]